MTPVDLGDGWDLAPEQQCQLHVLDSALLPRRRPGGRDRGRRPGGNRRTRRCGLPAPLQDTFGQLYRDRLVWYVLRHDGPPGMPEPSHADRDRRSGNAADPPAAR